MKEIIKPGDILYKIAQTKNEFDDARLLFRQYSDFIRIDLSFQDFLSELNSIEKQYYKPKGALILAYKNTSPIGCTGIREFDNETAELKRMFVQVEYQGYKIGAKLLDLAIDIAKSMNYKKIRLDTLASMTQAQRLYRSFNFYEIPPYRFNPIDGTVFMEKIL